MSLKLLWGNLSRFQVGGEVVVDVRKGEAGNVRVLV